MNPDEHDGHDGLFYPSRGVLNPRLSIHAQPCFDRAALQEHSWSVALLETEPCSDEYVAEPKLTDLPQLLAHQWHG